MNIAKLKKFITGKLERELSGKLTYHGVQHTLYVLKVCNQYITRMQIPAEDAYLLRTAALMHDTGYLHGHENHEERSMAYASKILPDWNYTNRQIEKINGMIRATKVPQKPDNLLERIIGDADLDYLGTGSFYTIGDRLYREFKNYDLIHDRKEWDRLQVDFLQKHRYHTQYAKKHREPVKQKHLQELLGVLH